MRGIFSGIFRNIAKIFSGYNLLWHLSAWTLTFALVNSGFDWFYFEHTRNAILQTFLFPAVLIGALLPILGIPAYLAAAAIRKKRTSLIAAYALGQAGILGLLVSDFYKALTGRLGPPDVFTRASSIHPILADTSHVFHFGILRGGVFFGWPSSHTTVAFAMAAALVALFPKNRAIRYGAIIYAAYIGVGVSATIHWFSDFAAGVIFGSVVGIVVGNSFRKRYQEKS